MELVSPRKGIQRRSLNFGPIEPKKTEKPKESNKGNESLDRETPKTVSKQEEGCGNIPDGVKRVEASEPRKGKENRESRRSRESVAGAVEDQSAGTETD